MGWTSVVCFRFFLALVFGGFSSCFQIILHLLYAVQRGNLRQGWLRSLRLIFVLIQWTLMLNGKSVYLLLSCCLWMNSAWIVCVFNCSSRFQRCPNYTVNNMFVLVQNCDYWISSTLTIFVQDYLRLPHHYCLIFTRGCEIFTRRCSRNSFDPVRMAWCQILKTNSTQRVPNSDWAITGNWNQIIAWLYKTKTTHFMLMAHYSFLTCESLQVPQLDC